MPRRLDKLYTNIDVQQVHQSIAEGNRTVCVSLKSFFISQYVFLHARNTHTHTLVSLNANANELDINKMFMFFSEKAYQTIFISN